VQRAPTLLLNLVYLLYSKKKRIKYNTMFKRRRQQEERDLLDDALSPMPKPRRWECENCKLCNRGRAKSCGACSRQRTASDPDLSQVLSQSPFTKKRSPKEVRFQGRQQHGFVLRQLTCLHLLIVPLLVYIVGQRDER